ncbi:hypothetical protein JKP88DRAFT_319000 [Tribonema minus]|uniref:Uncharacterized protein n=1 Tax=Tribonema minus TaxID=303371 RepID=A0A835Z3H7_9STRA|nr:hypothetical protein JKP88DRAFT_319000 [Tribonema minus]
MSTVKRVVIVPGNGCVPVARCNWYAWMANQIRMRGLAETVELRDMPDPYVARESAWLPFIVNEMGAGEDTVVVGHSSGAVAAMRLCETQKLAGVLLTQRLAGVLLVSACHTDLGDDNERASGYYSRPWRWDAIRANAGALLQLHSADDPLIPVAEARHVAASLRLSSSSSNSSSSSAQVGSSGSSSSSGGGGGGGGGGGSGSGGGNGSSQSLGEYRELKRQSHFFEPSEDLMAALRDVIESANAK